MVGVPITNGNPDAAACEASCSASIFDRVYRPGILSAGNSAYSEPASCDEDERKRMDSVEQCTNRATRRLRAASITTWVPWKLTVWKSLLRAVHMPGRPAR